MKEWCNMDEDFANGPNRKSYPSASCPPPLVWVSGSHRQIGQQIGEACKAQIRHSIENARNMIEETYNTLELHWEGAQTRLANMSPLRRNATRTLSKK